MDLSWFQDEMRSILGKDRCGANGKCLVNRVEIQRNPDRECQSWARDDVRVRAIGLEVHVR